ncbi:hypothetical protein [Kordia sp.]|uniref:hypothetical protein n=1 Tax=Kordia sp. TaxID=1965332 RepID=UPI003B599190
MRKIYVCMMFLFLGLCLNAQTERDYHNFKNHQVDNFINEVYGDQAQKMIFSNQKRYDALKKLIVERMQIIRQPKIRDKVYPKITERGMLDMYNKNLKHDSFFNKSTFNPLKYNIEFFDIKARAYRIDNTEYLLIIQPQPKLKN